MTDTTRTTHPAQASPGAPNIILTREPFDSISYHVVATCPDGYRVDGSGLGSVRDLLCDNTRLSGDEIGELLAEVLDQGGELHVPISSGPLSGDDFRDGYRATELEAGRVYQMIGDGAESPPFVVIDTARADDRPATVVRVETAGAVVDLLVDDDSAARFVGHEAQTPDDDEAPAGMMGQAILMAQLMPAIGQTWLANRGELLGYLPRHTGPGAQLADLLDRLADALQDMGAI